MTGPWMVYEEAGFVPFHDDTDIVVTAQADLADAVLEPSTYAAPGAPSAHGSGQAVDSAAENGYPGNEHSRAHDVETPQQASDGASPPPCGVFLMATPSTFGLRGTGLELLQSPDPLGFGPLVQQYSAPPPMPYNLYASGCLDTAEHAACPQYNEEMQQLDPVQNLAARQDFSMLESSEIETAPGASAAFSSAETDIDHKPRVGDAADLFRQRNLAQEVAQGPLTSDSPESDQGPATDTQDVVLSSPRLDEGHVKRLAAVFGAVASLESPSVQRESLGDSKDVTSIATGSQVEVSDPASEHVGLAGQVVAKCDDGAGGSTIRIILPDGSDVWLDERCVRLLHDGHKDSTTQPVFKEIEEPQISEEASSAVEGERAPQGLAGRLCGGANATLTGESQAPSVGDLICVVGESRDAGKMGKVICIGGGASVKVELFYDRNVTTVKTFHNSQLEKASSSADPPIWHNDLNTQQVVSGADHAEAATKETSSGAKDADQWKDFEVAQAAARAAMLERVKTRRTAQKERPAQLERGLQQLQGVWRDEQGSMYAVLREGSRWAQTCSVMIRKPNRTQPLVLRNIIKLMPDGGIMWGAANRIEMDTFSNTNVHWLPVKRGSKTFSWIRLGDHPGSQVDWSAKNAWSVLEKYFSSG